ncbi:MAG: hydratase [Solobacterium sp.]|nr:hydratase [Solobacterium sp.]
MRFINQPVQYQNGRVALAPDKSTGKDKTLTSRILNAHQQDQKDSLFHLKFDSLTSHDITYVGIIQSARASGLEEFPMPYVLTNCHNTLCAVGGTINEDDHQFALSAAHKYGGIYVPANMAVIHSYNREMMTGCGRMILGSDSHTRYGALGTMGIGEGGGELVKQLLGRTYDIAYPKVILVYVTGSVKPGVGPQDVALTLIKETYPKGLVKNAVLEFVGPGIHNLSQDFRNGIDVMTTETACLSSIWETDEITKQYYENHKRSDAYCPLIVEEGAVYDACIELDLSEIECMMAMPMHPMYALSIHEFLARPEEILKETQARIEESLKRPLEQDLTKKLVDGNFQVEQGIIAGCSGGIYENIMAARDILKGGSIGNGRFRMSVYPDSMPIHKALVENGCVSDLLESGVIFREAFCGPCFGAGDTPANGEFSIRHTTRNFPNREGSKPNEGQQAFVALMDARSIAATAKNGGILTAASDLMQKDNLIQPYVFDASIYEKRVYDGYQKADKEYELLQGPNIKDWPSIPSLKDTMLVKVVSYLDDPVTTTDELIPSGETSSYRSNPLRLAEFTLSRRDPNYVTYAKQVQALTKDDKEIQSLQSFLASQGQRIDWEDIAIVSAIYANQPGDGSAREQAASCQRVLGAGVNFALSYATKRYRSNCINWGILPFIVENKNNIQPMDWIYIKNSKQAIKEDAPFEAYVVKEKLEPISLSVGQLSKEEREVLLAGCLINYYRNGEM